MLIYCVKLDHALYSINYGIQLPYSGKFSYGANFHIFRMLHPLYEKKNLNLRNFFLASVTFDLHHTQSLAQLQVLTMSRYRFFAKASNSLPTAAVQILL